VRRRLARFFSKATDPSVLLPASVLARLPRAGASSPSLPTGDPPAAAPQQEDRRGKYWALSSDQCAICAENASYDIAHLSATAHSTARTLTAETPSNSSAYRYTPISSYAVRASRPHHASQSHGINSLGRANTTTDEDLVDTDAVSDANMSPPFPITTPYRASCGHAYCYFCLAEKMIHFSVGNDNDEDDGHWECLRCEQRVTSAERVLGIDGGTDEDGVNSLDGLSDVDRDVGAEVIHK
jgi:peroxin-2